MESYHGEIATVQRILRIPVLTSNRTCGVAAKQRASVRGRSEGGTA
jgi:hypothetical protein